MASSTAPLCAEAQRFLNEPLSDARLARLANACGRRKAPRGTLLIDFADTAGEEFFLLRGHVTLTARDGRVTHVEGGSDKARVALARLRPRQYQVRAASDVEYVLAGPEHLRCLVADADGAAGYQVSDVFDGQTDLAGSVFLDFVEAVRADRIRLPTLPDLAVRIRALLDDDRAGAAEVGRMVGADPAIAAKLVRLANSAAYRRNGPVVTVEAAVARLGLETTRDVVTAFCVNELFQTDLGVLRGWLERLTEHSRNVAAVSSVLSRELGELDPGQALLAGLLHEVGVIPLLVFAETYPELATDDTAVRELLDAAAAEASELLLNSWRFDQAFIDVARHAGDWGYAHDGPMVYCDIVQLAKAHCLIKAGAPNAPRLQEVAAFDRAKGLTVELSLRILRQAQDGIAGALSLLA